MSPLPHPSELPLPALTPAYLAHPDLWEPAPVRVVDGAESRLGLAYARPLGWRPLLLDLHLPDPLPSEPVPVVVYAHGGSFVGGVREMGPWAALPSQGIAVATIDYRLAGEAHYPEPVEDVRAAVRWVRGNAGRFGLDPSRVAGWGSSAGGLLVALAAYVEGAAGRPLGDHLDQSSAMDAVVLHYAPSDPSTLLEDSFEPTPESQELAAIVLSLLFGAPLADVPELAASASVPAAVARTRSGPPAFLSHGDADHRCGLAQSRRLQDALTAAGIDSTLQVVPGADHAVPVFASPAVVHPAVAFLRRVWSGPSAPPTTTSTNRDPMAHTTKKPAPGQTLGAEPGPDYLPDDYAGELTAVAANREVGTTVWFENEHVQIWDLALQPGERVPFHTHDQTYFWTVTDAGRLQQRFDDGTSRVAQVEVGHTNFMTYGPGDATVHDLENVGDTFFRCVTVVLKDL